MDITLFAEYKRYHVSDSLVLTLMVELILFVLWSIHIVQCLRLIRKTFLFLENLRANGLYDIDEAELRTIFARCGAHKLSRI